MNYNHLKILSLFCMAVSSRGPCFANSDVQTKILSQIEVGKEAFKNANFATCEKAFTKALSDSRKNSLEREQVTAFRWLIETYSAEQKFGLAEQSCGQEIGEFEQTCKNPDYLIEAYDILAFLQTDEKKFKDAQSSFLRAEEYGRDHQCSKLYRIGPLLGLGQICFLQKQYSAATKLYEEALELADSDESNSELRHAGIACTGLLAIVYEAQGQMDKVDSVYKSLFAKSKTHNDRSPEIADAMATYANYLVKMDRLEAAKQIFEKSLEIFRNIGDVGALELKCRNDYASLLRKMNLSGPANKIE